MAKDKQSFEKKLPEVPPKGKDYSRGKGKKTLKLYGNDFSQWNKYPDLMRDAARIPFNWRPGLALGKDYRGYSHYVSGVVRVALDNTYGVNNTPTDPINVFARAAWLDLHRKYRGIGTYQAADLAMVQIATAEVFALIAKIERIYGVINKYMMANLNMPDLILRALHVPGLLAEDIRAHFADFRYQLNRVINKAQTLCALKGFEAIRDRISLYQFIYKDFDKYDAQYIVFDCNCFGIYKPTLATGSSVFFDKAHLKTGLFPEDNTNTYMDIINYLEDRVEALVGDDDVQRIYSDMIAAYGTDGLIKINSVPEDYTVEPVYDAPMLHKWHNAFFPVLCNSSTGFKGMPTLTSYALPYGTGKPWVSQAAAEGAIDEGVYIYQVDNTVISNYSVAYTEPNDVLDNNGYTDPTGKTKYANSSTGVANAAIVFMNEDVKNILDIGNAEVTDEKVVEGCLWKTTFGSDTNVPPASASSVAYIESCALEVPLYMEAYVRTSSGSLGANAIIGSYVDPSNTDATQDGEFLRLTKYDWHPLISFYGTFPGECETMGDLNRATVATKTNISAIHTIAMMSAMKTDNSTVKE